MKKLLKAFTVLLAASVLGGCAVYGPPPVYSEVTYYEPAPVYVRPAPVYVHPAPVYVHPAPVYVEPPFSFRFSYRSGGGYSGRGYHHGHRHHRR